MPTYNTNINTILFEEDVKKIYDIAPNERDKVLISLMWLFGARTSEMISLSRDDFDVSEDYLSVRFKTLKKAHTTNQFQVVERILKVSRPGGMKINLWVETICKWADATKGGLVFAGRGARWLDWRVAKLSQKALDKPISPYHFRHSCFSQMARNNCSAVQIQYWKGAKSLQSVGSYIHYIPQVLAMENMNRSHALQNKKPVKEEKETTSEQEQQQEDTSEKPAEDG